jgi:hypothetical protein
MCVHVLYIHITHTLGVAKSHVAGSYVDVPNSYNKLFEWLFSSVLASHNLTRNKIFIRVPGTIKK